MRRGGRALPGPPAPRVTARRPGSSHPLIYAVVRRIPRGRVATYGQVASLAGRAGQPRLAGYALNALPEGTPLPWHRVVGAGGQIRLARRSAAAALTQRLRLEREGVRFDPRGRVDLARFGWRSGNRGRASR